MQTKMRFLRDKVMNKILDWAIGEMTIYVMTWCWNQTAVQEMRRKFEGLLGWAKSVNPTAQRSNSASLRVRQLLRQLEDEAKQGKELLDGEPTAINLSNAKERFERIKIVTLELNHLLLINEDVSTLLVGVNPRINHPQFNPRYLQRRTRFHVISRKT